MLDAEEPLFSKNYVPWDTDQHDPSILLHSNIPIPLHGIVPRILLGKTWWDKERAAAKERTQNHCAACTVYGPSCKGNLKRLEGHEFYVVDWRKKTSTYKRTDPLCPYCHNYIHSGRLRMLLDAGTITHQHYAAVIKHGDTLLALAGLVKTPAPVGLCYPEWGKWKLIVFGISYRGHSSLKTYTDFHKKREAKDE